MRNKALLAPLILIVIGVLFLLSNFGLLPPLGALFHRWWPVILIAVGVLLLVRRAG